MQFLAPFTGLRARQSSSATGAVTRRPSMTTSTSTPWRGGRCRSCCGGRPGREAFPGDIFNLHSRLLERAAKSPMPQGRKPSRPSRSSRSRQGTSRATFRPTSSPSRTGTDLPRGRPLQRRPASRRERGTVGVARGGLGPDPGHEEGGREAPARDGAVPRARGLRPVRIGSRQVHAGQITRGERLTEILKQRQYSPVPVENQVMILFAGTNRYLDDVPTARVRAFEVQFLEFMRTAHADVGKEIPEHGTAVAEVEARSSAPPSTRSSPRPVGVIR